MELAILGYGYSAAYVADAFMAQGGHVWATRRTADHQRTPLGNSVHCHAFDVGLGAAPTLEVYAHNTTHLLISIPPVDAIASAANAIMPLAASMPNLRWLGYFSTTGVYGDANGGWVDESTQPSATHERALSRLAEERAWLSSSLPSHIFRISGIYGRARSALDQCLAGTARRIYKEGHVFSRIHVADIAQAVLASMLKPSAGNIYNLADDYPCPAHEVVSYASDLLGMPAPQLQGYDEIAESLSPMMREFYSASRRVSNQKIKQELGVRLEYPSYREGLEALMRTTMHDVA